MLKSLLIWDREFCATWPGFLRVIWRFKLTAISSFFASYFVDLKSLGVIAVIAAWIDGYLWVKHQIAYNPTSKGSKWLWFRMDIFHDACVEVGKQEGRMPWMKRVWIWYYVTLGILAGLLGTMVFFPNSINFFNMVIDHGLLYMVELRTSELKESGFYHVIPIQRAMETFSIYLGLIFFLGHD